MATRRHLLLLLLVAAVGCDAARYHSRFLKRVQNRQSSVSGNQDNSSGTVIFSSTASSTSSSYYGDSSSASPVTVTTRMVTDATQTTASSSAGTTSGNYSYGDTSNTGGNGSGTGNGMGNGMGNGGGGGMNNGSGTTSGTNNGNSNAGSNGGNNNGTAEAPQRPNILIFIADDLGRSDVSFTEGNIWTPTPHIDKLAWDGIILNRHYTNPVCTPSRSAFMTGKDAYHLGMQTAAISQGEPWGIPLEFKFQPAYFKNLGYQTYHVGKWHLGEFTRQYYPDARGFDYSYGFTGGATNWWNYTEGWIVPVPLVGREVRENGLRILANDTNNCYFPDLINTKAEQLIRNQDPSKPFYMYFATPIVHTSSNQYGVTLNTVPRFELRPSAFSFTDEFPERKQQLALVQALDDSFKRITEAIVSKGIANNTIVVFFADNGASIPQSGRFVRGANYGVNWPLRQGKGSLFEGAVRTVSFIWSPLLKKRGRTTNQLFHSTDWLPTLYEAAGGDLNDLADNKLDGVSQWKSLQCKCISAGGELNSTGEGSSGKYLTPGLRYLANSGLNYGPRKELVNNIDQIANAYAMIYEDQYGGLYKLLGGNVFDNSFIGWFPPPGTNALNLNEEPDWKTWTPTSINCNFPEGQEVSPCRPNVADCLFDLTNDPCETNNIATSYPAMLQLLQSKIKAYNATSYPSVIKGYDPASNPVNWDGWWVPWLDPVLIQDGGAQTNPLIPVTSF